MKKSLRLIAVAAAAVTLCACNGGGGKNPSDLSKEDAAMKAAVEQYVPGVIYEIYGNLADEAENLHSALAAAKAKAKAGTLKDADMEALKETFFAAREWWEKSEAFLFGAATVYKIDPHIDSWPLDKQALAKNLVNASVVSDLDEDGSGAIGLVGQDALGFHGIEFILFRNGAVRKASDFSALALDQVAGYSVSGLSELIFAAAVAEDLMGYCFELQAAWDPEDYAFDYDEEVKTRRAYVEDVLELPTAMDGSGMTFGENLMATATLGSTYKAWTTAVNAILVAGCSNICNEVANTKIATAHNAAPADPNDVTAPVNYIESPYSKRSFHDFKDNILSIQYSLYGKNGATAPEKNSIFSFLDRFGYDVKPLKTRLDAALASLDDCIALGAFVDNLNDKKVDTAIDAINALDEELNKAASWVLER